MNHLEIVYLLIYLLEENKKENLVKLKRKIISYPWTPGPGSPDWLENQEFGVLVLWATTKN